MATRFGAASPAHTYAARVRWLVGGLVAVILVLVVTLVFVSQQGGESAENAAPDSGAAVAMPQPAANTVDILIANQRIEAGTSLMTYMFTNQPVHQDRIPDGAVLARDAQTVVGKFSKNLINANLPLIREDISDIRPISAVTGAIPPGFRAVTIKVDARSGVEGWAQPNTRVDVLWTYVDEGGRKKVATIVHFSKILSVGGATGAEGAAPKNAADGTTVTLLVSELDAKKIELARSTGVLSLSLVGEKETGKVAANPEPIDVSTLLPRTAEAAPQEDPNDGVMYTTSPDGKQVKYILVKGRWKRDSNF